MFGLPATILVVLQMALLSNQYDAKIVMSVGVIACVLWVIHAITRKDKFLLITNVVVMGFAIQGVVS